MSTGIIITGIICLTLLILSSLSYIHKEKMAGIEKTKKENGGNKND